MKIQNIKTDKEEYIFWEDKEVKISFEIISEKKTKIRKISALHTIEDIQKDANEKLLKFKKEVFLIEKQQFQENEKRKYTFSIPIKIFNCINGRENFTNFKIQNFLTITIKKRFSKIQKKKPINIILPWNFFLMNTNALSKNSIDKQLLKSIEIKNYYNFYSYKKDWESLEFEHHVLGDFTKEVYQIYKNQVLEDWKKSFTILDKNLFRNSLKEKRKAILTQKENNSDKIYFKKINRGLLWKKDLIHNNLYTYLKRKYFFFRFHEIIRNNFVLINGIFFFGWSLYLILFFKEEISSDFIHWFFLCFFMTIFTSLVISVFLDSLYTRIRDKILRIHFQPIKKIKKILESEENTLNNIFSEISILYPDAYSCSFEVKISYYFFRDRNNKWKCILFEWPITMYSGNSFSPEKVSLWDVEKIKNLYTSLQMNWYISNKKILCKISYSFESKEIMDKNGFLSFSTTHNSSLRDTLKENIIPILFIIFLIITIFFPLLFLIF